MAATMLGFKPGDWRDRRWIALADLPRTGREAPGAVLNPPDMPPQDRDRGKSALSMKIALAERHNPENPRYQAATRAGVDGVGESSFVAP